MKHTPLFSFILTLGICLAVPAQADPPASNPNGKTLIYFLRHCEDSPELEDFDPSFSILFNNCVDVEDDTCCEEVLIPLGQARAAAWAQWFQATRITESLTHVIASHKIRTRQTVERIALAAGLGGDLDGDGDLDGSDVDQAPGDGLINVPSTPLECDPGFTGSSSALDPQVAYLHTLPIGSRAVVCTHSPVMYPLMESFGIDTSDPVLYPRNSRGRVSGFNNLWVVELTPTANGYQGRLLSHLTLDLKLDVSAFSVEPRR